MFFRDIIVLLDMFQSSNVERIRRNDVKKKVFKNREKIWREREGRSHLRVEKEDIRKEMNEISGNDIRD